MRSGQKPELEGLEEMRGAQVGTDAIRVGTGTEVRALLGGYWHGPRVPELEW